MYLYVVIKTEVVFVTVNFQKENFVSQNRNSDAAFGKILSIRKCIHRSKQNDCLYNEVAKIIKNHQNSNKKYCFFKRLQKKYPTDDMVPLTIWSPLRQFPSKRWNLRNGRRSSFKKITLKTPAKLAVNRKV